MADFGTEDGATCWRNGCQGVIAEHPVENCSCHISPPCSACTNPREYCPECGWEAEEEERAWYLNNTRIVATDKTMTVGHSMGFRPLDPRKLEWHSLSHSNSSMIKEGVYPEEMTQSEVEMRVKGTFGGRFEYFRNGKFKYIAYTD